MKFVTYSQAPSKGKVPGKTGKGTAPAEAACSEPTSNLKNHVKRCAPSKGVKTIEDHIPGAKYTKALMRFKLLTWVARRHRPYSIVEDPELRDIFQMLYARVEVPSARTISRDVQEVFELSRLNLIAMLKVHLQSYLM